MAETDMEIAFPGHKSESSVQQEPLFTWSDLPATRHSEDGTIRHAGRGPSIATFHFPVETQAELMSHLPLRESRYLTMEIAIPGHIS